MREELEAAPFVHSVNQLRSSSVCSPSAAFTEELSQLMHYATHANVVAQLKSVSIGLSEGVQSMRYNEGDFVKPHFDNGYRKPDGSYEIIYPNRMLTNIIFLNDDFEGGKIIVNKQVIKPIAGMMVIFPSDSRYEYSVSKMTRGTRLSAIGWFTVHGV